MKVDADTFLLTRGQWLVDAIVQAGVTKPTRGRLTEESTVDSLRRYIGSMGGRSVLLYRLQCAQDRAMTNPRNLRHLNAFAQARQTLERHVKTIEIANGKRFPLRGGTLRAMRERRKKRNVHAYLPKGWSVSRVSKVWGGKIRYRLSLTCKRDGRPRQVGTFGSKKEAEREGIRLIAELRGGKN